MKPKFFRNPQAFRSWLEKNHAAQSELIVGYYKVGTGKPSLTWPQSVDEALCFGWIDGVRRSLDDLSYTVRFTPRRPSSTWSSVNIKRVQVLIDEGRMRPAGLAAFERRMEHRSSIYSYEQREAELPGLYAAELRSNKRACRFFEEQSPSYRKAACWWVVSARKEETRVKRLQTLIELSQTGNLIPQFVAQKKSKTAANTNKKPKAT